MIHSVVGGATLNTCNTTAGCSLVSACWTYTLQHHSETNSATPGEDGGVWFQAKNAWTASWCWILPVSGHCTDTSLCYVWLPVLLFFFLLCGRTRPPALRSFLSTVSRWPQHSELPYTCFMTSLATTMIRSTLLCVSHDIFALMVFNFCHLRFPRCITVQNVFCETNHLNEFNNGFKLLRVQYRE